MLAQGKGTFVRVPLSSCGLAFVMHIFVTEVVVCLVLVLFAIRWCKKFNQETAHLVNVSLH